MVVVKVFIGGLPPTADDSTVAELFSAFGQVESVTLSRDPSTLLCAGYGFAKLSSEEDAKKVIAALHNQVKFDPEGHPNTGMMQLRIVRDTDNTQNTSSGPSASSKPMKLFMGGVPSSATGKTLRALFQPFGEILDLFIAPEKGYAFVKFTSLQEALAAMAGVNGTMLPNAVRPLEVRIAQSTKGLDVEESEAQLSAAAASAVPTPARRSDWTKYVTEDGRAYYHNKKTNMTQWEEPDVDSAGGIIGMDDIGANTSTNVPAKDGETDKLPIGLDKGPPGANVFVYGLPDRWREREFADEFKKFGEIVSIKVIYDKATGTSKGYGFISYTEPSAAEDAVRSLHGSVLAGRRLKVQIKRGEDMARPY
jgi:CUG-BP- and ETR3-like factor